MQNLAENTVEPAAKKSWPRLRLGAGRGAREIPVGVASGRWQALVKNYVRKLHLTGGQTIEQRTAIFRCAALNIAAERVRTAFLRHEATIIEVDMAERALLRAEKNLQRLACSSRKLDQHVPLRDRVGAGA